MVVTLYVDGWNLSTDYIT